jgi:hypothetical protein
MSSALLQVPNYLQVLHYLFVRMLIILIVFLLNV